MSTDRELLQDRASESSRHRPQPAVPDVRDALQALFNHCAEQGWWLQSHAVQVMDKANAALAKPNGDKP